VGRKVTGILLILLTLSLEFNSILLTRFIRVSAQPEELAKKLEEYLGKAIPDDLLAEGCEYVVPEGFNSSHVERLWRDLGFYVSAGYTTSELRGEIKKLYGNYSLVNATLSNGKTVALNISGIAVEREWDGSVSIRIPVASSGNLSYVKYNFTKTAGFYEAWNKTLVREYRVWRREQGWYEYVMSFLETNRSVRVVSRIWGREALYNFSGMERVEWTRETGEIPIFTHAYYGGTIMVAIPGHYEDARIIVPEQERNFKVLFPAYDPIIAEGWVVSTSISSTSLSLGETLQISYWAEYYSFSGEEPEPLNATLTLSAPDAFQPLDSVERTLNDAHTSGFFSLKAVKPGTYNLTLRLTGNACFSNTLGNELTYEVQVVSPPAPSLSVTILGVNTTILKHAGLTLRLTNNGGSTARNVNVEITGSYWDGLKYVDAFDKIGRSLGDVEAGGTRIEEFVIRLRHSSAEVTVKTTYSDEDGNPYMVKAYTSIYHPNFWVPEHFETYTVTVPEHEETLRVFVPSYEKATHVRLYALWDPYIVGAALPYMRYGWTYEAREPVWGVGVPTHVPTLGLDSMPIPGVGAELPFEEGEEALREAGVKIMITSIEPYYEYIGILKEDDALRLVNTSKESLRSGNVSSDFKVRPLKPYWVKGKPTVLNSTQFALYQATMESLKKNNPDLDYEFRETMADVRTRIGGAGQGYIVLTYRPLKVVGEGPLKSVRVRNFAAIGFNYRVDVNTSQLTFFGKVPSEKAWKNLYLSGKEDAVLLSSSLDEVYEREVNVSLTYNGKLVAKASFILKPEASPFWRGFWDGLASQAWKIVITVGLMIIVGFVVPAQHVITASHIILGVGVVSNLVEVALDVLNAYAARDEMNVLADECVNKSIDYLNKNMPEHANEYVELARKLRAEANATIDNLGINALSNLFIEVGWDEVCVALGWKEPIVLPGENRDYKIGYARGRVAGAIILCMLYAALYVMVVKIKAERVMGQPLSTRQVLGLMGRGLYNWITPAVWDATVLAIQRKGIKAFGRVADLLLGNKYSRRFGDAVGSLLEKTRAAFDPPKADEALETASGLSKHVLENVPSRESSGKILDAIGVVIEHYSLEELEEKGGTAVRSIVSMWIRDGDEAVDSLNSLLNINAEDSGKMSTLEKALLAISGNAVEGVGLKIGDIVDSYLGIKDEYGEDVAEAFLNAVLKSPNQLEEVLAKLSSFEFKEEPHKVTLKRGGPSLLNLGESNKVKPGTYIVRVYWEYGGKSGVAEFSIVKDVESDQINIPKDEVERALDQIGRDEAEALITEVKLFDYRLLFPTEFVVSGVKVKLDLFNNEIEIGGNRYGFKQKTHVWGERIRVDGGFEGKNIEGKNLVLSFYEDGEVRIKYGEISRPVKEVNVEAEFNLIRVKYSYSEGGEVHEAEYSFNLKSLSEQMGKISCEILLEEDQTHIGLEGWLFRLLGYDALKELEEGIGSKYGILVGFDGGKKAYCGAKELEIDIPEGASKIERIKIVSIKDKISYCLHEVIETRNSVKIGEAGEYIVIEGYGKINYQRDILKAFSEKSGIPMDALEGKVKFIRRGGGGEVDGILSTLEDIVVDGEVVFKKDDVITIIEMESTISGKSFKDPPEGAIDDLKNHLQLDKYKNVKYGIAIGFSYDPKEVLAEEPGVPPLIKVYTRGELEG